MAYEQAQLIIDGKFDQLPEPLQNDQQLIKNIKLMNSIAQKRRKYRYETGSLFIDNFRKRFKLDEEYYPQSFSIEDRGPANFMVEEFMLLANKLVGETLIAKCKRFSLLRKHDFPKEEKIFKFKEFCK